VTETTWGSSIRRFLIVAAATCGLLTAPDAHTDASLAPAGTGGLVFAKADRISMQREKLLISSAEVRVRYELRNDRGVPHVGHGAFALPPGSLLYAGRY